MTWPAAAITIAVLLSGEDVFVMNLPAAASAAATAFKQGGYLLGIAESCTGGLIAAELSEIAGASQWFSFGIVAYTNNAKKIVALCAGTNTDQTRRGQ